MRTGHAPGVTSEKQVTVGTGESFGRFSPDGQFVSYTGAPTKDDPVSRITIATWDEATGTIGVGRTLKAVSGDADGAIWSPDSGISFYDGGVSGVLGQADVGGRGCLRQGEGRCGGEESGEGRGLGCAAVPALGPVHGSEAEPHYRGGFSLAGANPRDLTPASAVGDAETPTWFLGAPLQYAWAPDSKEIAYVTNLDPVPAASTNNDVFTLRLDEPGAKAVKVSTSPGSDDAPAYSPDGKWLAFRSQKQAGFESDRFRLMLYDREKKTIKE